MKRSIVESVSKNLKKPHYRIFFFGSRVAGKSNPRSDFDIGIDAGTSIPLAVLGRIKGDLENLPILQKLDIVDFGTVGADFKTIAIKNIEVIYEK